MILKGQRGKGMKIERFSIGILGTNCYLVTNEETRRGILVDPSDFPMYLKSHIEKNQIQLEGILLTHGHFDHIMGIDACLAFQEMPVYIHEGDEEMILDEKKNLSGKYTAGYTFSGAKKIREGEILSLIGYEFLPIHTPGHTKGSCCYYVEKEGALFSGDTLFQRSIGRTDLPGGSGDELRSSIHNKLFTLPEAVRVYPGHQGETEIGYEKEYNPYV